ncbi:MAG: NAD-dependent epimerase/dehydratase family protein [Phycisphaerales bacterium]|nr:NAD-dependent epimerase/dehydratase family protein [Phycisphaerales bacterium]
MRILILGGSVFIGRHIAAALLAAGHEVTTFTRGRTPDELPAAVERLHGDRDLGPVGLEALRGRTWDACIDVSGYTPRQVGPAAEMLRGRVGRYIFISAVAVYGDPRKGPVDEGHPRVRPAPEDVVELDGPVYGMAKVACEDIVNEAYGERCAILRPQIVVGPGDPSGRYAYWVRRAEVAAESGGEMLAPGDGSDHLQVVDVRDLARFAVTVVERGLAGPFNSAGPRMTWHEFMRLLGVARPVWVPAEVVRAAGVNEFELPLYREKHGPRSGLMHIDSARARAAGLVLTEPARTLEAVREWLRGRGVEVTFSPEREADVLAKARLPGGWKLQG